MSKTVSGVFSDLHRVLVEAPVIQARVKEMAAAIQRDFAGKVITVVAVMDGGLFFVADLLRSIDLPMRHDTINASSYHGGTHTTGEVKLPWPASLRLQGEHVLLLDDILDSGLTLTSVQQRLRQEDIASLHTGVLLKKNRPGALDVPVDYMGFEIEDEFVVGYGMDYQGRFRNLPCIGTLQLD
jgi:hypoxanthine phosphoribosyltransferase